MTPKRSAGIREEEQHSRSLWYTDGRWMLDLDGGIKEDQEEESLPAVAATVITRGEGPTVLEKWYLDLHVRGPWLIVGKKTSRISDEFVR
ncbi:hypothetical protein U1Q18_050205 [Sarracenia purpurea var. burkii]